jgi:hypothetical protein
MAFPKMIAADQPVVQIPSLRTSTSACFPLAYPTACPVAFPKMAAADQPVARFPISLRVLSLDLLDSRSVCSIASSEMAAEKMAACRQGARRGRSLVLSGSHSVCSIAFSEIVVG